MNWEGCHPCLTQFIFAFLQATQLCQVQEDRASQQQVLSPVPVRHAAQCLMGPIL